MKVAILGAGPTGVELALKFHLEGASLSLFEKDQIGANLLANPEKKFPVTFKELISMNGMQVLMGELTEILAKIDLEEKPTYNDYVEKYLLPIAQYIGKTQAVTHTEVLRVQKRYILKNESPQNRSRLNDLFRVVYKNDPTNSIATQMSESPEAFENLDPSVIESLNRSMEGFEDFDLVIDTTANSAPKKCGNGTFCIGEKTLRGIEGLYYGNEIFDNLESIKAQKEVAIIGSGETAARSVIEFLKSYDGNKRIFLVTTEEVPFERLREENSELYFELEKALKVEKDHFSELTQKFLIKLKEWEELEDYMKAKMPRPAEPIPNYVIFSGHNISSIDRLIDKDKFFLTCEIPEFRNALVQKENGVIPLKTISTNAVLVATGFEKDSDMFEGLNISKNNIVHDDEPGFYTPVPREFTNQELEYLSNEIFNNVMTFFRRA